MRRGLLIVILVVFGAPAAAHAGTARLTETVNDVGGRSPLLTYSAQAGESNRITTSRDGFAQVTIRDDGAPVEAGAGCKAVDAHAVQCSQTPYILNGVELQHPPTIIVEAGDGADVVAATPSFSDYDVYVLGGDGADMLTGAGHLVGGPGDDVLTSTSRTPEACYKGSCGPPPAVLAGGTGNDVLRGGLGDDIFTGDGDSDTSPDPGGGSDVIDGGPGSDSVTYAGRATPVRVDLGGALPAGAPGEVDRLTGIESVTGGKGPDVLLGGDGPDGLYGGPGDDTIDGRGGSDRLDGGPGSDTLLGRDGNDELVADQLGDALYGGPGDDTLWNPVGNSLLFARVVQCGSGRDVTFTPQGQLIAGCELVRLGELWVKPPRRLRDGRLRTGLECRSGLRCEIVVKVRRGSTVLARRSVTIPFGRTRTVDLRPRARVRAGQTVDVTVAGRDVVGDPANGPTIGSIPINGRWRMRL